MGHQRVALEDLAPRRLRQLPEQPLRRAHRVVALVPRVELQLVPIRLVLGVQVHLNHVRQRALGPLALAAREVERLERGARVVCVPVQQPLAEAEARLERGARRRVLRLRQGARRLLEAASTSQQLQQLDDRLEVGGRPLEQLLEVEYRRLPLRLLQHQVGEDHRRLAVRPVDAHQRHAQLLRRLELAARQLQPRERQDGLLVRVVVLQRLPVRAGRLLCVALLLVAVGELVRDVGRRIALRAELVRRLDTHAGDHGRLRGARARQRGHRVLQRPPLPVHAREQDERTHLLAHVVQRLVRRALQVVEQLREFGLRLVVLLELAVQLGELVAQHLWRRARTRAWWPHPPTRRRVRGAPARTCLDASFWNAVE